MRRGSEGERRPYLVQVSPIRRRFCRLLRAPLARLRLAAEVEFEVPAPHGGRYCTQIAALTPTREGSSVWGAWGRGPVY